MHKSASFNDNIRYKNIYFDTNGNGLKDDDEDYKATIPGKWTTDFQKSFGNIRVRLTVFDTTGKKDFVDKDIVFDAAASSTQATYMASVLGIDISGLGALLVSITGFGILALSVLRIRKEKN